MACGLRDALATVDLAEAGLLLAADAYPGLDVAAMAAGLLPFAAFR